MSKQTEKGAGPAPNAKPRETFNSYTRHLLVALLIVAVALFFWQAINVLLLAFGGTLLAVIFSGLASRVADRTPLSRKLALTAVLLGLLGVLVLLGLWLGPRLSEQFQLLAQRLPESFSQARQALEQTTVGQFILQQTGGQGGGGQLLSMDLVSRLTGVASTSVAVLVNILIVLAVGIFFSVAPETYKGGLARLVPKNYHDRVREYLDTAGYALWRWLMGKLVAMAFVGIFVSVGLAILGVPLALILGLIAGLLDFVPFIGPIAAALPAVLLAFTQSPTTVLWVALLYFLAQQIEGDVISPLIQQQAVSLSPAMEILAAVTMALVFGIVGAVVAVPLFVVIMVGIKMLYMHDVLGYEVDVPRPPGTEE